MEAAPPTGIPEELRPGLRRVIAPNPSPMTFWGTNSYLIGDARGLCVVDPGPEDPRHLAALLDAIGAAPVSHIVVTHSHLDHSPLARPLAKWTGAEVLAFGDHRAGRSAAMQRLIDEGFDSGGEGIDRAFIPDRQLADGDEIGGPGWRLRVLHTPGHLGNHICLRFGDAMLTGDHVMGWASSLVSPPDGDLTDFMASCRRLKAESVAAYYPGHGAPVTDPAARLDWLIDHRLSRETQILELLSDDAEWTLEALTGAIYTDTPTRLHPAAARNMLAHLIDLAGRNRVTFEGPVTAGTRFRQADQ